MMTEERPILEGTVGTTLRLREPILYSEIGMSETLPFVLNRGGWSCLGARPALEQQAGWRRKDHG